MTVTGFTTKKTRVPYEITESEEKTRKWWLASNALYSFFVGLNMFSAETPLTINILMFFIVFLSNFSIPYYFIYKKHGTRLLTFWLASIFLLLILNFPALLVALSVLAFKLSSNAEKNIFEYLLRIGFLAFGVWDGVLSYKLRKVNKKIQLQALITPEGYRKTEESILEVKSLEELGLRFKEGIQEWPNHFSAAISSVYNKKRKELESNTK